VVNGTAKGRALQTRTAGRTLYYKEKGGKKHVYELGGVALPVALWIPHDQEKKWRGLDRSLRKLGQLKKKGTTGKLVTRPFIAANGHTGPKRWGSGTKKGHQMRRARTGGGSTNDHRKSVGAKPETEPRRSTGRTTTGGRSQEQLKDLKGNDFPQKASGGNRTGKKSQKLGGHRRWFTQSQQKTLGKRRIKNKIDTL